MGPPRVAVVTRTKDREVLLPRAIASVVSQTFRDWVHVIVNDAGDPSVVERCLARTDVDRAKVIVVHRATSHGMEAASNAGLVAADSKYVVVHDDDDSWQPEFLERTVAYLEDPSHERYGGVVTHSVRVSERIENGKVEVVDRDLYNGHLRGIVLHELAGQNSFPPISFLYRRSVLDEVGHYRVDLPPLADWEFNLRVLSRRPIGLLPEPLANYHHRILDRGSPYGNTVVAGVSLHQERDSLLCNEFVRRDVVAGTFGLGSLLQAARGLGTMLSEFGRLHRRLDEIVGLDVDGARAALARLSRRSDLPVGVQAEVAAALEALAATPDRGEPPADPPLDLAEYLNTIERHCRDGDLTEQDQVAILGASPYGLAIARRLTTLGVPPAAFLDNAPDKQGKTFGGLPVRKPGGFKKFSAVIVASLSHAALLRGQVRVLARGTGTKLISSGCVLEVVA
jgi:glycosyltransferase involved in cell wall biosynthesis